MYNVYVSPRFLRLDGSFPEEPVKKKKKKKIKIK